MSNINIAIMHYVFEFKLGKDRAAFAKFKNVSEYIRSNTCHCNKVDANP